MNLLEYQARELFKQFAIPTMKAATVSSHDDFIVEVKKAGLEYPLVAKVQIPAGKRGKAGGVRFADNENELSQHLKDLLHKEMLGFTVNEVMIVEKARYEKEFYLSIMLDRLSKMPMLIFSTSGGMDIEEVAKEKPDQVIKLTIDPLIGVSDYHVRYLSSQAKLGSELQKPLLSLIKKLYACFMTYDCLLCEINPLVVTEEADFIAIDGKVQIDDSSLFRHQDMQSIKEKAHEEPLVKEAELYNFLYIPVEKGGKVAVMSNGSGMLMSCIDLISKEGYAVAAALDLGGGSTSDRIKEALRILFSTEGVESVMINIFGGITRCDEVANGIVKAWNNLDKTKSIIVRLEGTNKELGLEILQPLSANIITVPGLREAVSTLVERLKK